MIVVCNLESTRQVPNSNIRGLVQRRIYDLGGESFDSASMGYFLVVEYGDTEEALNAQLGFDLLCDQMTGIRYGQRGFSPSFKFVEELPYCFDMVFIISDDGFGIEVFIPKSASVLPDLIAMCQQYAFRSDDEADT